MTLSPQSALASVASSLSKSCDDAGGISGQTVWCMLLGASLLLTNFLVAGFTGLVVVCSLFPIASLTVVPLLCVSCSLCTVLLLRLEDDSLCSYGWVHHDQKALLGRMLKDTKERGVPIHSWQTSGHQSPMPNTWRREGRTPSQEDMKSRLLEAGTYKDCADEPSAKKVSERAVLQTEVSALSKQPLSTEGTVSRVLDQTSAAARAAIIVGEMGSQLEWWAAESHVENRSRSMLANCSHDSSLLPEQRNETAVKSGTGKQIGSSKSKKGRRGASAKGLRQKKAPPRLSLEELAGSDCSDTAQPDVEEFQSADVPSMPPMLQEQSQSADAASMPSTLQEESQSAEVANMPPRLQEESQSADAASMPPTTGAEPLLFWGAESKVEEQFCSTAVVTSADKTPGRRRRRSLDPIPVAKASSSWRRRRASEGFTLPTDATQLELNTKLPDVTELDMPSHSAQSEEDSEVEEKSRSVPSRKRMKNRRSSSHAVRALAKEVDETLPRKRQDRRRSLPLPPSGDADVHSLPRKIRASAGPDVMAMTFGKAIGTTLASDPSHVQQ